MHAQLVRDLPDPAITTVVLLTPLAHQPDRLIAQLLRVRRRTVSPHDSILSERWSLQESRGGSNCRSAVAGRASDRGRCVGDVRTFLGVAAVLVAVGRPGSSRLGFRPDDTSLSDSIRLLPDIIRLVKGVDFWPSEDA